MLIITGLLMGGNMKDILATENSNVVYEKIDVTLEEKDIENVEIDVAAGKFVIKRGDKFSIKGEGNVKQSVKNGTWKLEENYEVIKILFLRIPIVWRWNMWNGHYASYEITIPYDADLRELNLDLGAGKAEMSEVQVQYLNVDLGAGEFNGRDIDAAEGKISVGAGNAELNGVTFSQQCKLDVGMGELKVENGDFTELKIDNGAGSTKLQGKLYGKIEVDNGVGDIKINCAGKKENYAFDIDNGIGTIKINGESYSDKEFSASANQLGEFDVDNGIGDVRISFE